MPARTGRKRKTVLETSIEEPSLSQGTSAKRQRKLPVRAKDSPPAAESHADETLESAESNQEDRTERDAPVASTESTTIAKVAARSHMFFDDDEAPAAFLAPIATAEGASIGAEPAKDEDLDEGEDESSDDDAPEAVSTAQAATATKKSSQAVAKAIEQQEKARKQKRKDRDARLKEQAAKRKEAGGVTAKEESDRETEESKLLSRVTAKGRRKHDGPRLPDLLPAEFLTDSSDDEAPGMEEAAVAPKRRRVQDVEKELARERRVPRDEVVGSTAYRVLKKDDGRLAPKARRPKQHLFLRHRTAVRPRKGFLVKK